MHKKIYLSAPHMSGREQHYISEAFRSNWIAPLGPLVNTFEEKLAERVGTKGAAAVSSGTAAIHLALRLLDVKAGDTVFCPSFTFVATANPILYEKAVPVFIDSEPDTWNMSPKALERALEEAKRNGNPPKAVIAVNLYGQSAKMDEIVRLCGLYGVPVIEDAAESLGSVYKGKQSGTFGRFGVYSFNGNKIITTSGGGMLVSDDEAAIEKARFLASQARDPAVHYQHSEIGHNYRLSNILAGVGIAQLEVLDERVEKRREIFARYEKALGSLDGVCFMPEYSEGVSNRWLTALTLDNRLTPYDVVQHLAEEQIEARPLWKPLHTQPLFTSSAFYSHTDSESVCENLFRRGICLPSGTNMTEEDQDRVIDVLSHLFQTTEVKRWTASIQ
ncbi:MULTISPECIES: DegT/DnrJ/EryC1/StrS family aminotransferase [Bacillus]|uniref:DegT/DnrJ/EryC1/StrS family aminotransferase n=1 Tax=Bacillus TaxID=1386 RepID=UPI00084AFBDE|nr:MULTISPECIES: aminotransferase class I/II-fold pyridoxal phosphate-dependent enzyme [Bacillus]MBL4978030.1 aminotransferase class I/II-fold pyridoxal phosphate-dependent enzyme [Bacillus halotolerans]OEC79296.1 pyridoxal phosphate-dependent aminotransferase [Bacillus halotolerans]PHI46802.1 pyridoxal phosphate-dependent aminotransferase [Bacillus halotolerans]UZD50896.1 aminotransferase class I/II-fold pyridoxal phosphate-dependent enzyme [Bacillus halotolerans]WEY44551.1 aminotransferase c